MKKIQGKGMLTIKGKGEEKIKREE